MKLNIEIFEEQLPFARSPFSYEFIAARALHHYRIRDSKDDPVGWADTEREAVAAVAYLNFVRPSHAT